MESQLGGTSLFHAKPCKFQHAEEYLNQAASGYIEMLMFHMDG
jgi:hypothetical protein